ncbi:PH domain-containing protein [Robertmurraya sp. 2P01SA]|uniref:PH domain-containing protein n=1 Tax=Robertmurraya TaxID=2837507 RepID=UPI0039A53386
MIFCADSIPGNELNLVFEYLNINRLTLKIGLMNEYISMKNSNDVVKFKQIMSDNVEDFITEVQKRI